MATRAIPVPDETFRAPRWVLGMVGALTVFMGGSIGYSGLRGLRSPEREPPPGGEPLTPRKGQARPPEPLQARIPPRPICEGPLS